MMSFWYEDTSVIKLGWSPLTKTIYDQKQFLSSVIYGNLFKQKNELIIQISIIATESWANLQDSSSENQCFAIAQLVLNASKDT